jgi:hypothetical protein
MRSRLGLLLLTATLVACGEASASSLAASDAVRAQRAIREVPADNTAPRVASPGEFDSPDQIDNPGQYADLRCGHGSQTADTATWSTKTTAASVEVFGDGSVGIVLTDGTDDNSARVVGCMSAETAAVSREAGLSLASVTPARDGVLVVIASPASRDIVQLAGVDPIGRALSTASGFDAHTYVATEYSVKVVGERNSATDQVVAMIEQARSGVVSIAGLGPELLKDSP